MNLVSANRIIKYVSILVVPEHQMLNDASLDLSWNYASESQAYDRVHRLGQDKDVFVKRLVVRNTIEERWVSIVFPFDGLPYTVLL